MNRSPRRSGLLVLLLALLALVLARFWRVRTPLPPHERVPVAVERLESRAGSGSAVRAARIAPKPIEALEEALSAVGEHSGEGWVACPFPWSAEWRVHGAIYHQHLDGGVLRGAVQQAEGRAFVRRSGLEQPNCMHTEIYSEARSACMDALDQRVLDFHTPVASLVWSGALPGQQGDCRVVEIQRRPIGITVIPDVDVPRDEIEVRNCAAFEHVGGGRFEGTIVDGQGCNISIQHCCKRVMADLEIPPDSTESEFVVHLGLLPFNEELARGFQEEVDAYAELLANRPPCEVPPVEDQVSPEAWAIVRGWCGAEETRTLDALETALDIDEQVQAIVAE